MPGTSATDVLIVGAGPTGLVLALWLTRLGVRVRIIDKVAEPGTTSRALAVQARTLEFYQQMGLADTVVADGLRVNAANIWVAGRKVARAVLGDMGARISPFSYALIYPQDEHERMLTDRLREAGVQVERPTELMAFDDAGDRIVARLKRSDGRETTCEAAYVAGCDGAHSAVRETLKIGFPGGTYEHLFYVADLEATGPVANGELNVALDTADFLAVFPLKGEGRLRFVGTIRPELESRHQDLTWDDVSRRVIEWLQIDVTRVNWFSTYRVHHRVAEHFRQGRAFLVGDAAHIHSPVGGQGMNTGIGDAVNLAWKLAAAIRGRADARLLESYEPERIAFARRLIATTDQGFVAVTSHSALARLVRLRIVPLLFPLITRLTILRRFIFRTISQTTVNYRGSALSEGRAGEVHGGDRLPWVPLGAGGADNFAPLRSIDWQVHVYGAAGSPLRAACEERKLPLHEFPWRPDMDRVGLQRDAAYLLRPDGYVALADPIGSPAAIAAYLDERKIQH